MLDFPFSIICLSLSIISKNDNFSLTKHPTYLPIYTAGTSYEELKDQIEFIEDYAGVSHWVMRLPRKIYSSDLKVCHYFTEGSVEMKKVAKPTLVERWKYFVITRSDGRRLFCTAQIYYEKGSLKCFQKGILQSKRTVYQQFYLPRCIVLLSQCPYFKLHVNLLKIYGELRSTEPGISHSINQAIYQIYQNLLLSNRLKEWQVMDLRQAGNSDKTKTSLEFTFNYYIACCNQNRGNEAVYIDKANNREVLQIYQLQPNSLFQFCYIFHMPFSSETIRIILSAILQEKQIIFVSNNQNLSTLVIQTLMKMILPFKWSHMYVPNLPQHLIKVAEQSFLPYIVGISSESLQHIDTSERVVVMVEQNRVIYQKSINLLQKDSFEFLTFTNIKSKNYIESQRQIRTQCLLLMHSILQQCLNAESAHHNGQKRSFLKQSRVSLRNSFSFIQSATNLPFEQQYTSKSPYEGVNNIVKSTEHKQLIKELVNNSMMYKRFKEQQTAITHQTYQIIRMPPEFRKNHISHQFQFLQRRSLNPYRFDNLKNWISYYDRTTKNRRKIRTSCCVSFNNNYLQRPLFRQASNTTLTASTVRLGQSRILNQSRVYN